MVYTQKMRFLGIDYGTKRIGLALSDEEGGMAFPHSVIPNDDDFVKTLVGMIKKEQVGAIVLGESKDFEQKENPIMEEIHRLKDVLEKEKGLSVYLEPEFFTSAEARRLQGKHEKTDASAAAIILQSYLDRQGSRH